MCLFKMYFFKNLLTLEYGLPMLLQRILALTQLPKPYFAILDMHLDHGLEAAKRKKEISFLSCVETFRMESISKIVTDLRIS